MKDWIKKLIPIAIKEFFGERTYILKYKIQYHSKRYGKWVVVEKGFESDGATGARDIYSESWWVHDKICKTGTWDDGTKVTAWQAATVLYDILIEEERPIRATLWRFATFLMGCKKAKENGWY